jgi:predicted dehydrogenase
MAGHVLRYHPQVCRFVARVRAGEVGVVERVVARRFTQSGSPDPLWTLACHDVATLFAMDASDVVDVAQNGHNGMVALSLGLSSGVEARIEVSTKSAEPQRRTEVFGSAGTLCLDELATEADALRCELDHFASCVRERVEPRTSFADARSVVATLERADEALA